MLFRVHSIQRSLDFPEEQKKAGSMNKSFVNEKPWKKYCVWWEINKKRKKKERDSMEWNWRAHETDQNKTKIDKRDRKCERKKKISHRHMKSGKNITFIVLCIKWMFQGEMIDRYLDKWIDIHNCERDIRKLCGKNDKNKKWNKFHAWLLAFNSWWKIVDWLMIAVLLLLELDGHLWAVKYENWEFSWTLRSGPLNRFWLSRFYREKSHKNHGWHPQTQAS